MFLPYRLVRAGATYAVITKTDAIAAQLLVQETLDMYGTAARADQQTNAMRALQLLKSEYLEMPGLRLTVPQASRLIALDAEKTQPLLEALVDTGFLRRTPTGFIRA